MLVSAGWYLALVSLWPTDSRPYIGGSTDNSLLQLALGYNGLGRIFGGDGNPGGGSGEGPGGYDGPMGGATMFGGGTGITRMFDQSMGTEISWLLPAAIIGLLAGLWFTRRAARTDRRRAALLLWGGWLVVTALVFSFMKGIMHPYYTVALAPAIAAVIGISVRELWRGRQFAAARWVLAAMVFSTGAWNFVLLDRTPDWLPWLRWVVLVGCHRGGRSGGGRRASARPLDGSARGSGPAGRTRRHRRVHRGDHRRRTQRSYSDLRPKPLRHGHGIRSGRSRCVRECNLRRTTS